MFSTLFGFRPKVSKEKANLILAGSSDATLFVVNNGMMLRTLYELRDAFMNMSEETFYHHVNETKNDFHNWIKDVHQDEHLATDMLKAKNKNEALLYLEKRLSYLEKRSQ
jgi:hypothetical protein